MDIAEILKNVPVGMKLYSPVCGEVEFVGVVDGKGEEGQIVSEIKVKKGSMFFVFNSDGRYLEFPDAEMLLFPSKTTRNWVEFYYHFSLEEGEPVCVSNDGEMWFLGYYSKPDSVYLEGRKEGPSQVWRYIVGVKDFKFNDIKSNKYD